MRIVEKGKKFGYPYRSAGYTDSDDNRFAVQGVPSGSLGLGYTGGGGYNRWGVKASGTSGQMSWIVFADGTMMQAEEDLDRYMLVCPKGNQYSNCSINDDEDGFESAYPSYVGSGKFWWTKPGRYRRDGPGEPVSIDGVDYTIHIASFGQVASGDASPLSVKTGPYGTDARYLLEAEPASIVNEIFLSDTAKKFQWASGDDAFIDDRHGSINRSTTLANFKATGALGWDAHAFSTSNSDGTVKAELIAVPVTKRAIVDVAGLDWPATLDGYHMDGKKVSPITLQVTVDIDGAVGNVGQLTVKGASGTVLKTVENVSGMVQTAVPLGDVWEQIPVGQTYVELTAGTGDAQSFPTRVIFEKASGGMEVLGKPHEVDSKPVKCSIIAATVLGDEAGITWQVCNNANDSSPAWEEYTGPGHVFANESKEVGNGWAVNWRCAVYDNGSTSRSELIKQVGMAVL